MNQPLFARFVEVVKEGRVEGATAFTIYVHNLVVDGMQLYTFNHKSKEWKPDCEKWDGEPILSTQQIEDILCAHLRRWLTGKGWHLRKFESEDWHALLIGTCNGDPINWVSAYAEGFTEGTELDQAIEAVLWSLDQEVKK